MPSTTETSEQVLALLAAAPPRLRALTEALQAAYLQSAPQPEAWSANEVLAHLRACADVWGECMQRILAEERPTLRAINPRTWISRTNYLDLDFHVSLGAFVQQRTALLAVLAPLPSADWSRSALVTGAGTPLERTVFDYARRLAEHERPHLRQIARAIAGHQPTGG